MQLDSNFTILARLDVKHTKLAILVVAILLTTKEKVYMHMHVSFLTQVLLGLHRLTQYTRKS